MDSKDLPAPWIRETPLVGDASTRRYSRLVARDGRTAILVRYPAVIRWQLDRDLEVRSWCAGHGVRVPALLERPSDADWALVEDLGSGDAERSLRDAGGTEREGLLAGALSPISTLADIEISELPGWNAPLDRSRLRWELAGFELWFLRHRCGSRPETSVGRWLDRLAEEIDGHPTRICHRDFHINNLFFLPTGEVAVIDYQDILVGPDTYDIVSLLNERAVPDLLTEQQRTAVGQAWARSTSVDPGWTNRAAVVRLQRALKVLGTFARFEAAGKASYVPWMVGLSRAVLPELRAVGAPPALTDRLLDL